MLTDAMMFMTANPISICFTFHEICAAVNSEAAVNSGYCKEEKRLGDGGRENQRMSKKNLCLEFL